jgi:hypothetical protein
MMDCHRHGQTKGGVSARPIAGKRRDHARFPDLVPALDSAARPAPALPNALKPARLPQPPLKALDVMDRP